MAAAGPSILGAPGPVQSDRLLREGLRDPCRTPIRLSQFAGVLRPTETAAMETVVMRAVLPERLGMQRPTLLTWR
jgi:hypothetical protein